MEKEQIEVYLRALGDILESEGAEPIQLFICGSVALMMQDLIARNRTRDVDCAGFVVSVKNSRKIERPVIERPLRDAIGRVARAYSISEHWLSFQSRMLLENGLPEGLEDRLEERHYGSRLTVLIASRLDMVFFKVKAAITREKDIQDLIEMQPTEEELEWAGGLCIEQGATWEQVEDVTERIRRG